ncbi:MAG: glycosyltransferase family 87 protein, partial [Solirubrobacteraceae bacterium]
MGQRQLLNRTGRRLGLVLLLVIGPLLVAQDIAGQTHHLLYDFTGGLFNAGVAILHGHSFYEPGFLAHQVAIMRSGQIAVGETASRPFSIPVYPAFANVAVVPLSVLPLWLAQGIYTVLSFAAMVLGLRLLGVRDWRCLALALISYPFLYGVFLGAVGPFLVLGAGIAWRWRDRLWPPALAIAAIVATKIFPWTLGVWLLITKRYRTAALTAVACLVFTFGAWAIIGWHGLAQYPQMLSNMSLLQEGRAASVVTVLHIAGLSPALCTAVAMILAIAILGLAWRLADGPDGDRRAFGLAIIAALTSTPIVWEHYMVLVFVPIALATPELSWLWLAPLAAPVVRIFSLALAPAGHTTQAYSPDALRTALPWIAVQAIVAVYLCTTPQ